MSWSEVFRIQCYCNDDSLIIFPIILYELVGISLGFVIHFSPQVNALSGQFHKVPVILHICLSKCFFHPLVNMLFSIVFLIYAQDLFKNCPHAFSYTAKILEIHAWIVNKRALSWQCLFFLKFCLISVFFWRLFVFFSSLRSEKYISNIKSQTNKIAQFSFWILVSLICVMRL